MFWKKQKQVESVTDCKYHDLWTETLLAIRELQESVKLAIVRNGVIDIYPDGPDKKAAEEDAYFAKQTVLNAIAHYESSYNLLQSFYKCNKDDIITYANWHPGRFKDSHEYVELAYKDFFQKSLDK